MKHSTLSHIFILKVSILRIAIPFILLLLTLAACKGQNNREQTVSSGVFTKRSAPNAGEGYDLEAIRQSGEIIVATISSPATYYDYHGLEMGLHYALAQDFATLEGVGVRVVVAADTTELADLLLTEEADVIAYPLSQDYIDNQGLLAAGYDNRGHWAVRNNSTELAEALNDWYTPEKEQAVAASEKARIKHSREVVRKPKAVFLSRDHGVISEYDALFKEASAVTGWDWRLIAAMCYQESAFDPNAKSYVGARGLMQLMPATAKELGVPQGDICIPETNVRAAARYIVKLYNTFNDVRDPSERLKFTLASYNGGTLHIRDAMALARKYGGNPARWDDVAPYVLGLQQPKYYKDPVVRHGYMIGSETANYVQNILERWRDYGGSVAITHAPQLPVSGLESQGGEQAKRPEEHRRRHTKFSSGAHVMTPDDPRFNQMED